MPRDADSIFLPSLLSLFIWMLTEDGHHLCKLSVSTTHMSAGAINIRRSKRRKVIMSVVLRLLSKRHGWRSSLVETTWKKVILCTCVPPTVSWCRFCLSYLLSWSRTKKKQTNKRNPKQKTKPKQTKKRREGGLHLSLAGHLFSSFLDVASEKPSTKLKHTRGAVKMGQMTLFHWYGCTASKTKVLVEFCQVNKPSVAPLTKS